MDEHQDKRNVEEVRGGMFDQEGMVKEDKTSDPELEVVID